MTIEFLHGVPLFSKHVYDVKLVYSTGSIQNVRLELYSVETRLNGVMYLRGYLLGDTSNEGTDVMHYLNIDYITEITLVCSNDPKDFGIDC